MKKKILTAFAAAMGISALMGISVSAQEAQYTDIDTYINHYPISAYAVDGKLAVVAEDLRDYGFNVEWDAGAWALHISRNSSVSQLTRKNIYKSSQASGTKFSDIYNSGISVDYNGVPMESYALNGYTLITVNDLAALAGTEEWNADSRYYNVWVDGLSTCEYKPLTQRCINLWYNTDYNKIMPDLDFWDDVNFDGQDEHAAVKVTKKNNSYGYSISAKISVNGSSTANIYDDDLGIFAISSVYLIDIDPNDGMKELAISAIGQDELHILNIYKLSGGTPSSCSFYLWNNRNKLYSNSKYISGYAYNNSLTVGDDNTVSFAERTSSSGLWDVYKTYKYDDYGSIVEVKPDVYTVVPNSFSYGANQWGYYPVYQSVYGRGIALNAGDYITPLYDDGNNNVYIRKSNGQEGWFSIDGYNYGSGQVSPMFILAN